MTWRVRCAASRRARGARSKLINFRFFRAWPGINLTPLMFELTNMIPAHGHHIGVRRFVSTVTRTRAGPIYK